MNMKLQEKHMTKKTEIIETANEMSREISKGTKEYADNLLANTEDVLNETLNKLEKYDRSIKFNANIIRRYN